MQTLQSINVGQAPNDGTGDEHRTAFQKVNANFDKIVEGFAEVDSAINEASNSAQAAADAAQAAAQAAGEAIPASQKGEAGGVAPLDSEGKLPEEYLPDEFIPVDERGVAGGVATLGVDGKVSPEQLPNAVDAIPLAEKGQAGGVATLDPDGLVPAGQLPPIPSGPAVGTPNWWPLRASIPAGQIPQDGQEVSRATYPDLAAMVIAGTLPVVAEATWQSDPTQRGKYTLGDGSTTVRVPDLNGKSVGSLGAVVRRGDGAMSAGTGGLIQRDALQNITAAFEVRRYIVSGPTTLPIVAQAVTPGAANVSDGIGSARDRMDNIVGQISAPSTLVTIDASRVARTATETRALNVTGVWTVHAFGAVVNPGSADAAQLASDYAVLNASVQTLQGQIAQAFGVGQQWFTYDVAERGGSNVYVNSTPQSILVNYQGQATAAGNMSLAVDGEVYDRVFWDGNSVGAAVGKTILVPSGSNYQIGGSSFNRVKWREYRNIR
ncbi:phage tail protein [Achromobacter spanius]|uniref:phage tail protein n=1 Tax=Achromobacter spanius TaxID=217203 RepID=UPI00320BA1DB